MVGKFIKLIFLMTFIFSCKNSIASEVENHGVVIFHPYIPLVAPNSSTASGYLSIKNKNQYKIFLKQIKTDLSNSMLHKTVIDDSGIVKMTHLDEIEIGANSNLDFEPGSYHIMFTRIDRKLVLGDLIAAKLIFNNNIEIAVEFIVVKNKLEKKGHSKHNH